MKFILLCLMLNLPVLSLAEPLPGAPSQAEHPGSKSYQYSVSQRDLNCLGRAVTVYRPTGGPAGEKFPVIVYGHGQTLDKSHYQVTFEHLAKKGVAVLFPIYDQGFFDQDWARMARDFVDQTNCALQANPDFDPSRVIYAGHSKGAYVASIAIGIAPERSPNSAPRAALFFAPAGSDVAALKKVDANLALTVIFSDRDTVVERSHSDAIFAQANSRHRQFILVKSYNTTSPRLEAGHMWPLTKSSFFGGGEEGPLHYYGAWKWLVAAAQDLTSGARLDNPYLYGNQAADKGISGEQDEIRRSW